MNLLSKGFKIPAIILLLLSPLNIIFTTEIVSAIPHRCQQIRQVRRLAGQHNLDGINLTKLESIYCNNNNSVTRPTKKVSQDCIDLGVMKRLARMTENNSNLVQSIEAQQQVTCQLSQNSSSFNWSNGRTAKLGSSWNYPNGRTAKFGSSWNYPNGRTAKFGSSWNYPNGNTSSLNNLMARNCEIVGREECSRVLKQINNDRDFLTELAVIELSWKAYQMGK